MYDLIRNKNNIFQRARSFFNLSSEKHAYCCNSLQDIIRHLEIINISPAARIVIIFLNNLRGAFEKYVQSVSFLNGKQYTQCW